jgi:hypothetical protein
MSLLSLKLVRPHKDIFVQILTNDDKNSERFISSSFSARFRHQHYVLVGIRSNMPEWIGGCGHRKCEALLSGKEIRVAVTQDPAKLRFIKERNGTLVEGDGVYYEMLTASAQLYNFTLIARVASDGGGSGERQSFGKWTGAAGDVLKGRSHFAVTFGTLISRLAILDFSATMDRYARVFYIPTPAVGTTWKTFFRPFSPLLWLLGM